MFPKRISELHTRNSKLSSVNLTLMHPKESMLHLSLTPHSTSPVSCQGISNAAYTFRIKKDRPLVLTTCYLEKKNPFKKGGKPYTTSPPKKQKQTKTKQTSPTKPKTNRKEWKNTRSTKEKEKQYK